MAKTDRPKSINIGKNAPRAIANVGENIEKAKGKGIQQAFTGNRAAKGPNTKERTRIERAGLATPIKFKGGRAEKSTAKRRQAGARGD